MRSTMSGANPVRGWLAIVLLAAMVVGACDNAASPTSSDPFAGSWAGAIEDRSSGTGTLRMTLSGDPYLSGTWSAAIAGQSLAGPASLTPPGGPGRALTLTCETASVRGSVAVIASVHGSTLEGSYFALDCPRLVGGAITLQKQ